MRSTRFARVSRPSRRPASPPGCASRCSARTTASCLRFVTLARELGAASVSFLAVDVSNAHAFARREGVATRARAARRRPARARSAARGARARARRRISRRLHRRIPREAAPHPRLLRRASCGHGDFPVVRCNAPEFSAVIEADGRVAPCFFIPGPARAPRAPALEEALDSAPMRALRASIRAGERRRVRALRMLDVARSCRARARAVSAEGRGRCLTHRRNRCLPADRPGPLGTLAGRVLHLAYRLLGQGAATTPSASRASPISRFS